jgi:hypothetical protein
MELVIITCYLGLGDFICVCGGIAVYWRMSQRGVPSLEGLKKYSCLARGREIVVSMLDRGKRHMKHVVGLFMSHLVVMSLFAQSGFYIESRSTVRGGRVYPYDVYEEQGEGWGATTEKSAAIAPEWRYGARSNRLQGIGGRWSSKVKIAESVLWKIGNHPLFVPQRVYTIYVTTDGYQSFNAPHVPFVVYDDAHPLQAPLVTGNFDLTYTNTGDIWQAIATNVILGSGATLKMGESELQLDRFDADAIKVEPACPTETIVIECENYDECNESDSGNRGGMYREGNVDVYACGEGGYYVGSTKTDEWLEFDDISFDGGDYDIDVRVGCEKESGCAFHVELDGKNVTGTVTVPQTWVEDEQRFSSVGAGWVSIPNGMHVVRIRFERGDGSYNWIRFTNRVRLSTPYGLYLDWHQGRVKKGEAKAQQ